MIFVCLFFKFLHDRVRAHCPVVIKGDHNDYVNKIKSPGLLTLTFHGQFNWYPTRNAFTYVQIRIKKLEPTVRARQ
jgi:hypothetical protein